MNKIRVLVVDDAAVVRRLICTVLSSDPSIEVVGTASNGRQGLEKIQHLSPDVVTLDIEMPEMNGLETLQLLRQRYPRLPVVMFSTLTRRGAAATLDALALGANDYVTKPDHVGSLTEGMQRVRDTLIPKIKQFMHLSSPSSKSSPSSLNLSSPVPGNTGSQPNQPSQPSHERDPARCFSTARPTCTISIVAIGVSTGGPNALAELLSTLTPDFPVPIVIVQHMPPIFTQLLAERLSLKSPLPVQEASSGDLVVPGKILLAPGDYHLTIVRDAFNPREPRKKSGIFSIRTSVHQAPPENSCRPAVDVLFRSVAATYGPCSLGVVLTGMGQDGLRGSEAIKLAGGQILAQDQASSVVWGMPGFVVRAGLADKVLPLQEIGSEIHARVTRHRYDKQVRPDRPGCHDETDGSHLLKIP